MYSVNLIYYVHTYQYFITCIFICSVIYCITVWFIYFIWTCGYLSGKINQIKSKSNQDVEYAYVWLCILCRLLGIDRLILYAMNEWMQDIKKSQLPRVLGGVGPMHSFVQLCKYISAGLAAMGNSIQIYTVMSWEVLCARGDSNSTICWGAKPRSKWYFWSHRGPKLNHYPE